MLVFLLAPSVLPLAVGGSELVLLGALLLKLLLWSAVKERRPLCVFFLLLASGRSVLTL